MSYLIEAFGDFTWLLMPYAFAAIALYAAFASMTEFTECSINTVAATASRDVAYRGPRVGYIHCSRGTKLGKGVGKTLEHATTKRNALCSQALTSKLSQREFDMALDALFTNIDNVVHLPVVVVSGDAACTAAARLLARIDAHHLATEVRVQQCACTAAAAAASATIAAC